MAAAVGLGDLLAEEPRSLASLTVLTGCDRAGLEKLLRYLVALGLVEVHGSADDQTYRWADTVRGELGEDWLVDLLRLDGPAGMRLLGILSLLPALRTGRGGDPGGAWALLGLTSPETESDRLAARLAAEDDDVTYLADPLVRSDFLAGHRLVRVSGRGAAEVCRALRRLRPDVAVRVLLEPAEAEAVGAELEALGVVVEATGVADPPTVKLDAHLWIDQVDRFRDDEAAELLRRSRDAIDGEILLVGESLQEEVPDDHECEDDLIGYSIGEAGLRTAAERDQLAARAGLTLLRSGTVGWGFDVRVLG